MVFFVTLRIAFCFYVAICMWSYIIYIPVECGIGIVAWECVTFSSLWLKYIWCLEVNHLFYMLLLIYKLVFRGI